MKIGKVLIVTTLLISLLVGLAACSDSSNDTTSNENQLEDLSMEDSNLPVEDNLEQDSNTDDIASTDTPNEAIETDATNENESIQEDSETKVEGKSKEFLERLDNIQKELDALPEKEDSDKGVTNAMKSYYGRSYEMYDEALNEIYAVLKKELSPETMSDLTAEQMKWIEQKEDMAKEEREKYSGGTFEDVAYYISLYETTKERCYYLVNEFM